VITIFRSEGDIRPDLLHRHGEDFFSVVVFGWQRAQRVYQCDDCKRLLMRSELVTVAKARRIECPA